MSTEQKEVEVKNALIAWLDKNFSFEGNPVLVRERRYDLTHELWKMFRKFNGEDVKDDDDLDMSSGMAVVT